MKNKTKGDEGEGSAVTKKVENGGEGEDGEEESLEEQMQRIEEKIFVLKEEIIELKGQIEGMGVMALRNTVIYLYYP